MIKKKLAQRDRYHKIWYVFLIFLEDEIVDEHLCPYSKLSSRWRYTYLKLLMDLTSPPSELLDIHCSFYESAILLRVTLFYLGSMIYT